MLYITNIVQCHSVLPCLLCIEVSLGKNIDKVSCNSKGSLPAAERLTEFPMLKPCQCFFTIYIFSLTNWGGLYQGILVTLPCYVKGKHVYMFTVLIKRGVTEHSIIIALSPLAGK